VLPRGQSGPATQPRGDSASFHRVIPIYVLAIAPSTFGNGFKFLRDTWADTTTAHGRLMLTILGGLTEFERELIRIRTGQGRERAKARGVILGHKPKLTGDQRREAIARREAGKVLTDIARSYNVSHSTIRHWIDADRQSQRGFQFQKSNLHVSRYPTSQIGVFNQSVDGAMRALIRGLRGLSESG
jgi:hypothetical protein